MHKRTSTLSAAARSRRPALSRSALVLLTVLTACAADAAPYTYTGGGTGTAAAPITGNFSNGFNDGTNSNVSPPANDNANATALYFGGSSTYTATNNLSTLNLNSLNFTNSGAVTLAASSFSLSLGGIAPAVNLNNTGNVTINQSLSLAANTTFTGNGSATIGGLISGSGYGIALGSSVSPFAGILTLTGANTYSGATIINSGTLGLDFSASSTSTNIINNSANSSALTLSGGTLALTGHSGSTINSQQFNGLNLNPGGSTITLGSNSQNLTVSLGSLTRVSTNAGTVNFNPNSGVITTTTGNILGIIGGYATINGSDWAANDGTGRISAYNNYTALADGANGGNGTNNYVLSNSASLTSLSGTLAGNTLKIISNSIGQKLDIGANNLSVNGTQGGLLFVGGTANSYTITGTGILGAGANGEFIVTTQSGTALTISTKVVSNGGNGILTKAGAGTLILMGSNNYAGGTRVNGGTLSGSTSSFGTGNVITNNSATVDYTQGSTSSTLSSNISGSGSVAFGSQGSGNTGTITYTGQNIASGGTSVNSGTLVLNRPSGLALSGPVAVATGGTLTINPNSTNNEIATTTPPTASPTVAAVTLNGGTLNANGSDGAISDPTHLATTSVTKSMGALALGSGGARLTPSLLNFGSGGTVGNPFVLAFADSSITLGTGYLNVTGYTGTTNALYIGTTQSLNATQLNQIAFNGIYGLAGQLGNGQITLSPTPEPSGFVASLLGAGGLAGLVFLRRRRTARAA